MDLQIHPPLPSKKDFRIGILGSGFVVNECHLPAYRKAGFNPVAIASRSHQKAAQTAQHHGIPRIYESYDDLLNDPSIEVLDIAVPPQAQLGLIRRACARKTVRGILAQKPLSTDYAEALEAVRCCHDAGIVLSVNQNMRYDQSVRAAKTFLQNGVIGQPIFATIEMRGVPHWMPWQAELGWATLRIMSIHHLDCFRYWFGDPQGLYCSVRPDPRTKFQHDDGICTYILEYADGLRCVGIDDPWTGPAKEGCPSDIYLRWRIEGLNGIAIGDIGWCRDPYTTPSTIKFASKGDTAFHEPKWTESWFPDAFIGTMAQLLIALEKGQEPAITGADNLKTMALVEAAYASAANFTSVNLGDFKVRKNVVTTELQKLQLPSVSQPKAGIDQAKWEQTWEKLTPRARQVLQLARREAETFHHEFISPEHVLLGVIALGNGPAFDVLTKSGLTLAKAREEIEKEPGVCPEQKSLGHSPYAPRLLELLASADKEAKSFGHMHVATEHISLALLNEVEGVIPRVLKSLAIDGEKARTELLRRMLGEPPDDDREGGFFSWLVSKAKKNLSNNKAEVGLTMMHNLTPRAQQALGLSRKEADRFNHNFVGTEHVLLGLIALGQGVAVNVLAKLGLDLANVRAEVEKQVKQVGTGPAQKNFGNIPYTPRVKKVLFLAGKEAEHLHHTYIGTEHILLGLLKEGDGVAARVLQTFGVDIEKTRQTILKELDPNL